MKKLLLLLLLLMLTVTPGLSENDTVYTDRPYQYRLLEDGSAMICGYTGIRTNLILPETLGGHPVTAIGSNAFISASLTSVSIPDSITAINPGAFITDRSPSPLISIHIGAGIKDIFWLRNIFYVGASSHPYPQLRSITISPDNPVYTVENNLLIEKETAALVFCPGSPGSRVSIPDWVQRIDDNVLFSENVTQIHLPDSLDISFSLGNAFIRKEDFILPQAITEERWLHFNSSAKKSTQKKLSTYYRKIDPAAYTAGQDSQQLEKEYPILREGAAIYVLESNTTPYNFKNIQGWFAEMGYTQQDKQTDYQLIHGKKEEKSVFEQYLTYPRKINADWLNFTAPKGCYLENLPGGLGIAWAVQNGYQIKELHQDQSITWTILADGTTSDPEMQNQYFLYTLMEDGSASIAVYFGKESSVTIPDTIGSHPVTAIGSEAFLFGENVQEISLPDSMITLSPAAFLGCTGLQRIHVSPDHPTLAEIDGVLFEKSTRTLLCFPEGRDMDRYAVPRGIRRIGPYAFSDLSMLNTSLQPKNYIFNPENIVYPDTTGVRAVTLPDTVKEIAPHAFHGNSILASLTIPEGLEAIGDYAFSDCNGLKEVSLPATLRTIGAHAFRYCNALERLSLQEGVTAIGAYAFANNSALRSANLPGTVRKMGDGLFIACSALAEMTIGQGLEMLPASAFTGCESLADVELPETLKSIGPMAFLRCTALTSMSFPWQIKEIPERAFQNCTALTEIFFSAPLDTIGAYAFQGCTALSDSFFIETDYYPLRPGNFSTFLDTLKVQVIQEHAFADCDALTNIQFQDGLTSIGPLAFSSCDALTSLTLPMTVTEIHPAALMECPLLTVFVPYGSYAGRYCKGLGIPYDYSDSILSWLEN